MDIIINHPNPFTNPIPNIPTPNNAPIQPNGDQLELILNAKYGNAWINEHLLDMDDIGDFIEFLWESTKNDTVFLVSNSTGEIFHITTVYDIINNWGFYAPFVLASIGEELEEIVAVCGGLFSSKHDVTYRKNGIMVHKTNDPLFQECGEVWKKYVYLTNTDTGKVTDEFYGSCNDFDMTVIAKIARGERFDIHVTAKGGDDRVNRIHFYLGGSKIYFAQKNNKAWRECTKCDCEI